MQILCQELTLALCISADTVQRSDARRVMQLCQCPETDPCLWEFHQMVSEKIGRNHRWANSGGQFCTLDSAYHLLPSPQSLPPVPSLTATLNLESKHTQIHLGEQNTQTVALSKLSDTMADPFMFTNKTRACCRLAN